MGLDATAYSHVELVAEHVAPREWCDDETHVFAWAYDFPRSYRGLAAPAVEWDARYIGGRCYVSTNRTETNHVHASYSSHGRFRELLARAVERDARDYWNGGVGEDAPFYELINFADNEGCIGPDAASDLVADFAKHADQFAAVTDDEHWVRHYADWQRSVQLASNDGLINFH